MYLNEQIEATLANPNIDIAQSSDCYICGKLAETGAELCNTCAANMRTSMNLLRTEEAVLTQNKEVLIC